MIVPPCPVCGGSRMHYTNCGRSPVIPYVSLAIYIISALLWFYSKL
jgi:hypothetical protein